MNIQGLYKIWDTPSVLGEPITKDFNKLARKYPWFTPIQILQQTRENEMLTLPHFFISTVNNLVLERWYQKLTNLPDSNLDKSIKEEDPIAFLTIDTEIKSESPKVDVEFQLQPESTIVEMETKEEVVDVIQEEIQQEIILDIHVDNHEEPLMEEIIDRPIIVEDYFKQEGIEIDNELPKIEDLEEIVIPKVQHQVKEATDNAAEPKDLMVMRSFVDWLLYFKKTKQVQVEEEESKKALKLHWQKEKLAAALEEEDEEIPEQVFNMAINSIQQDDDAISEPFADLLAQQGKKDKAIDMLKKLSLKNPDKSAYFARKIEKLRNPL